MRTLRACLIALTVTGCFTDPPTVGDDTGSAGMTSATPTTSTTTASASSSDSDDGASSTSTGPWGSTTFYETTTGSTTSLDDGMSGTTSPPTTGMSGSATGPNTGEVDTNESVSVTDSVGVTGDTPAT